MSQFVTESASSASDPINTLQREIALLEKELEITKAELNTFEQQIQSQLMLHIVRIQELFADYKQQKLAKKEKRLEQKKRGKNYKEPKQPILFKSQKPVEPTDVSLEKQELKRLYKQAVIYVHPDKFQYAGDEEEIKRATSITAQLNGVYKRGDLEELLNLYHYIVSGHRDNESALINKEVVDPKARISSLKKKKASLANALVDLKSSYTYQILKTYENPLIFIEELREQFSNRIIQLEKRTRRRREKG